MARFVSAVLSAMIFVTGDVFAEETFISWETIGVNREIAIASNDEMTVSILREADGTAKFYVSPRYSDGGSIDAISNRQINFEGGDEGVVEFNQGSEGQFLLKDWGGVIAIELHRVFDSKFRAIGLRLYADGSVGVMIDRDFFNWAVSWRGFCIVRDSSTNPQYREREEGAPKAVFETASWGDLKSFQARPETLEDLFSR